jgi:quinol monooxygenase YgiN
LLQHEEVPQKFISFGPWKDAESVANWRKQPQFKEFVTKAQELCEELEPQTMILVGHSNTGSLYSRR